MNGWRLWRAKGRAEGTTGEQNESAQNLAFTTINRSPMSADTGADNSAAQDDKPAHRGDREPLIRCRSEPTRTPRQEHAKSGCRDGSATGTDGDAELRTTRHVVRADEEALSARHATDCRAGYPAPAGLNQDHQTTVGEPRASGDALWNTAERLDAGIERTYDDHRNGTRSNRTQTRKGQSLGQEP